MEDKQVSRRSFLHSALMAVGAGATLSFNRPPASNGEGQTAIIGTSQMEQPLTVYRYGDGPMRLFILGGQHGGPEANTTELTHLLMEHLTQNPSEIPSNVSVYAMPEGNPDGLYTGSRQYVSGVDPNRNWGGPDWQSDAYDSNGRYRPGLGGPAPFSEQETAALGNWLWRVWPHFIINYHSAGGFMFGSGDGLQGELNDLYAQASGYWRPTGGGGGGGSPLGYRATGNMNGWSRSVGMGGCLIELISPHDSEFRRNLAGVQAVLQRLGTETPSELGLTSNRVQKIAPTQEGGRYLNLLAGPSSAVPAESAERRQPRRLSCLRRRLAGARALSKGQGVWGASPQLRFCRVGGRENNNPSGRQRHTDFRGKVPSRESRRKLSYSDGDHPPDPLPCAGRGKY